MSVTHIVRHFEGLAKVPIDIKDVLHQVRLLRPDEDIEITAVDQPFSELKAVILRSTPEDGTTFMMPRMRSEIVYSSQMPLEWQRLACCKELLHVLDRDPVCTTKASEVVKLADRMAGQMPIKNGQQYDLQALADSIAKWQAVAVLFPYGLWERIQVIQETRAIDHQRLAAHVELPTEVLTVVTQPMWSYFRTTILAHA